LRLKPDFANAHDNLGVLLEYLGRFEEAEASVRTALRLQPERGVAHCHLGNILYDLGRAGEAEASYRAALRLRPEVPGLHASLGFALLLAGQFEEGWKEFESRWVSEPGATLRPLWGMPSWNGEAIGDRAIHSYPPMRAAGTRCSSVVMSRRSPRPADVAHWRDRLAGLAGLRVGLCWAGGRSNLDRRRSITLDALAPLGEVSGVQFISLQKGPPAAEAARPPRGTQLHDFTEDLHDFADTAALIENLDLVISVDTAVAHLAGALGEPVWLLNRFDTCWRWLQNRDDSPWYPSLRLFRQPTPGDWSSVISGVQDALQRVVDGDHSQLRPPMLTS
jgi:tetratricopeptide (TPR) repeat protein